MKIFKRLALFTAAAAMVLTFAACAGDRPEARPERSVTTAGISTDGTAYLPLPGGEILKIDKTKAAALTADGKNLAVISRDGTLYFTDTELSEKKVISENCDFFYAVRDKGLFFYRTEEDGGKFGRAYFADGHVTKIPSICAVAKNSLTALYCSEDGVYRLSRDEDRPVKIRDGYEGQFAVSPLEISDDGFAVWTRSEQTRAGTGSVLSAGDENGALDLGRFSSGSETNSYLINQTISGPSFEFSSGPEIKSYITTTAHSKDGAMSFVTNTGLSTLRIKKPGEGLTNFLIGGYPSAYLPVLYCDKGLISETLARDISCVYVPVKSDGGTDVMKISVEGETETFKENIKDIKVSGGNVFYLSADGMLYLENASGDDDTAISENVGEFIVSSDGKHLCFLKDADGRRQKAALYFFEVGQKEPELVDGEIFYSSADSGTEVEYRLSQSGKEVFYLKNRKEAEGSVFVGDLMIYSREDKKSALISGNAVKAGNTPTLTSYTAGGEIVPEDFWFKKYVSSGGIYHRITADMMHFDGNTRESKATFETDI